MEEYFQSLPVKTLDTFYMNVARGNPSGPKNEIIKTIDKVMTNKMGKYMDDISKK